MPALPNHGRHSWGSVSWRCRVAVYVSCTGYFLFAETKPMKDQTTKDAFVTLRADGISYDRIARKLQVSKRTLI
jgi:hypothetical protein